MRCSSRTASFAAAQELVLREARVLEQRLFGTLFEGAPPVGVARALGAYRNDDGGLGFGPEADARCPESEPLVVALCGSSGCGAPRRPG
jgi:hypothetical protein